MAILGSLLKKGIKIRESIEQETFHPVKLQGGELRKLLTKAQQTSFGQDFDFERILAEGNKDSKRLYKAFKARVPT